MSETFDGEFRIVNWNVAGADCSFNGGKAEQAAMFIVKEVAALDANVITLQELSGLGLYELEKRLSGSWHFYAERFGESLIVTCVQGEASNVSWQRLGGSGYNRFTDWWGFVQLEYHGVQITNVHTRGHWADAHVEELHTKVATGIVAGDFNHESPGWHQTVSKLEPTHQDRKIDHILTVEKPRKAWGETRSKGGSNHNVVVATVRFGR